jgi:hypothetical protein
MVAALFPDPQLLISRRFSSAVISSEARNPFSASGNRLVSSWRRRAVSSWGGGRQASLGWRNEEHGFRASLEMTA